MFKKDDKNIRFVAFEGFSKLLLNNSYLPRKAIILSKLLIEYFLLSSNETKVESALKLQSMLCHFFELYFEKYEKAQLLEIMIPTFKYLINNGSINIDLKKAASYIHFIISETIDLPMLIMNSILDEIFLQKNFDNYNLIIKWILVFVEFNVHQFNIDQEKCDLNDAGSSVGLLSNITKKIDNLFVSLFFFNFWSFSLYKKRNII